MAQESRAFWIRITTLLAICGVKFKTLISLQPLLMFRTPVVAITDADAARCRSDLLDKQHVGDVGWSDLHLSDGADLCRQTQMYAKAEKAVPSRQCRVTSEAAQSGKKLAESGTHHATD